MRQSLIHKEWAIGISISVVILLVIGSYSNVVGYQTVQTSQQNTIKERINQRELLFKTIVDIANNKEIQRIILKSQMIRGLFPTSELPVLTKNQIRQMYFLGLIHSKVISKSRIQSMIGNYQFINQEIQKEIFAVIDKDTTLNSEISQLSHSECDCEMNVNKEKASLPNIAAPPIICGIVKILMIGLYVILYPALYIDILSNTILGYLVLKLYSLIIFPFWLLSFPVMLFIVNYCDSSGPDQFLQSYNYEILDE